MSTKRIERTAVGSEQRVAVGRRVFLGLVGLAALWLVFGAKAQNFLGNASGSGLGGLLPFGDRLAFTRSLVRYPMIHAQTIGSGQRTCRLSQELHPGRSQVDAAATAFI